MATNNFKPFSIGAGANVISQADYEALASLVTGFQSGKASSAQINKALRQGTVMASILAQYISDLSGADVLDNGIPATILTNFKTAVQSAAKAAAIPVMTGVVGQARNLSMSVTAASATAMVTADEIIVGTALGGSQYRIGNFSKTINLATTGAGGMDTGTVPATGFVAIYAIYNPTTGASALLAVNATSAVAPEVYGGANMPSGYSSSALISVWGISSSKFIPGFQTGRSIKTQQITILTTSSPVTTPTVLSITPGAPLNSRKISIALNVTQTNSGTACGLVLQADTSGIGAQGQLSSTSSGTSSSGMIMELPVIVSGQVYYLMNNSNPGNFSAKTVGYEI